MTVTPNSFAFFALLAWPLVVIALYSTQSIGKATVWAILGGYLLLPVGTVVKIPMIPQFDKESIPALAAFVAATFVLRRPIKAWSGFGLPEILITALLVRPVITSLLNDDPIQIGVLYMPGLGVYEAGSAIIAQFIILMPFFLGRQILRDAVDTKDILRALVVAGLVYSLPMLLEIRLSPQLHTWIYGYFPHMFAQQMREGGFRPVVFLGHGLLVAFLGMTSFVAAAALWRVDVRIARLSPAGVTGYLGVVLVLCKTLGALVYGAVLMPLVRWGSPRLQVRVASILVVIAVGYPVLRAGDLVPTEFFLELASVAGDERHGSLETRFSQEHQLLMRASERFWFGWGRFGRSRIYDEHGSDKTLSDGYWIITMGQFGFAGFLVEFGLLALTVLRANSIFRLSMSKVDRSLLSALAMIVAISIFDLLPNATIRPWTWLVAGALLGRVERMKMAAVNRSIPKVGVSVQA
ncbi:hypothetical protein V1277_004708 [Bradyrhizobium sp. AZCC 1588]|uniref:hypothetical protein n=1 Tax=unclassified Bradyrhizobium TaxID=2631580 RepID=UPI002FF0105E